MNPAPRHVEVTEVTASRPKRVKRITARKMRFITSWPSAIAREALFTFFTLFWTLILGLCIWAVTQQSNLLNPNKASALVLLLLFAVFAYITVSGLWQLGFEHTYIPRKSIKRFRLTERQLQKLYRNIAFACIPLYAVVFMLNRMGIFASIGFRPYSLFFFLGSFGFSCYFASKMVKVHGNVDQIASKYLKSLYESNSQDIILSFQSFKHSPKKGARVVGATKDFIFSSRFNYGEWTTTSIPFSEIQAIGICADARRSFSLDQPLYLPSSARIILQSSDGSYYRIEIDTTDGFQTNCFLFCRGLLEIFDNYLEGSRPISLSQKKLTRRIHDRSNPYTLEEAAHSRITAIKSRDIIVSGLDSFQKLDNTSIPLKPAKPGRTIEI